MSDALVSARLIEYCINVQYSRILALALAFRLQLAMERDAMPRAQSSWLPCAGSVATDVGQNPKTARNVRVLAEAAAERIVVEAIGRKGFPVRLTIKQENLRPLPPGLFDLG